MGHVLAAKTAVFTLAAIGSLALGVGSAAAQDVATPEPGSGLSSRLDQIASDASLRHLPPAELNEALSLAPHGAGSLMRDGDALIVEIRSGVDLRALADRLEAANADVTHVSRHDDTITAAVKPVALDDVAAQPGVKSITEVLNPMINRVGDSPTTSTVSTCAGSVTTEADTQMKAALARAQYDVDGSGVKVGVLSDSYDIATTDATSAAADVASGDLPGPGNPCGRTTPVQVLAESGSGGNDEGRGMAQLIHDLAPGATLAFATANGGPTVMADNIRALAAAGAKVIVDDVSYFSEPFYQDGPIAAAVNDVTAQGVTYFSSAANTNSIVGGNNIGSWESGAAPTATSACPAGASATSDCVDFNPTGVVDTAFTVTISGDTRVLLNWAEPWDGVTTNYDLYALTSPNGTTFIASSTNNNLITQRPFEILNISGTGDFTIAVRKVAGAASPRLKFITTGGPSTIDGYEYPTSSGGNTVGPTIFGHNGAANAVSTAAVPFNNASAIETFSSRGPVTTYFDPVSGSTPAPPNTRILAKPDLAATDGGQTTFFFDTTPPFTQPFRFFGTSAAAPDAAAVAALQLSANPNQSVAEIKQAQSATAVPVGSFGPEAAGAGLVNAVGAVGANPPPPPTVSFTGGPTGAISQRTATFTFTAGHSKAVACSVDGGPPQDCSTGSFTTPSLGDGAHTVTANATDFFGQAGSASQSFSVDTTGPVAPTFSKKPKKKTKSRKATFAFSGEAGATFMCALDKKAFAPCTSPKKVKVKKAKPKAKKHKFAVQAIDALGNAGALATYKWKVKKPL